jgi:hypothetical protein
MDLIKNNVRCFECFGDSGIGVFLFITHCPVPPLNTNLRTNFLFHVKFVSNTGMADPFNKSIVYSRLNNCSYLVFRLMSIMLCVGLLTVAFGEDHVPNYHDIPKQFSLLKKWPRTYFEYSLSYVFLC